MHLVGGILNDLADLQYKQNDFHGAILTAERAATISRENENREVQVSAQTLIGQSYQALRDAPRAEQALRQAIAVIEVMRADISSPDQQKQNFLEFKTSAYLALVDLLNGQGKTVEALAIAERAKGRVLLDILSNGRVNITKSMTAAEQAEERRLLRELNTLNHQLSLAHT